MVKLLEVTINGSFQFWVVINVHVSQFCVLTVLRIKLHKFVQLQHCVWVLVNAYVTVLIFWKVKLYHSYNIVIVEDGVFEVFRVNKLKLESWEDGGNCVPLDISFVLFCVITEQNSIIIDFNKDGTHFKMKHLMHWIFVSVVYSWVHPWKQ